MNQLGWYSHTSSGLIESSKKKAQNVHQKKLFIQLVNFERLKQPSMTTFGFIYEKQLLKIAYVVRLIWNISIEN